MAQYDISVIIPVYNVERYIRKCIESVIMQDGVLFEIILVDDGSTDHSSHICDEYAQKYENVRVIHKRNEGLGYARNSGIDVATGKYIFFLDSDDWIIENTLKELYGLALEHEVDMICFQYVGTLKQDFKLERQEDIFVEIVNNHELMEKYLLELSSTATTKLYKKYIFEKVRFTNVPIHEDAYSMHLFMEGVNKALITNKVYYVQYIRKNSLTQTKFQKKNLLCIECGERIISFIKEKYPELIIRAHFHKINRQIYTMNLILSSYSYFECKDIYNNIKDDLKKEITIVDSYSELDYKAYKTAKRITQHPFYYILSYVLSDLKYKIYTCVFRR